MSQNLSQINSNHNFNNLITNILFKTNIGQYFGQKI